MFFFIIHKKSKLFKTSNSKIIMNAIRKEAINASPITSAIPTLVENLSAISALDQIINI